METPRFCLTPTLLNHEQMFEIKETKGFKRVCLSRSTNLKFLVTVVLSIRRP